MSYSGTSEVERILKVGRGRVLISVDPSAGELGTSEIRLTINDADDIINAELSDIKDALPVTPTPGALGVASRYLAAYLVHTNLFVANKPNAVSSAVSGWKEIAKKAVGNYKANIETAGRPVRYTGGVQRAFTERGVSGVNFGDREGIFFDEDETDET